MYSFDIEWQDDDAWLFELNGIHIIVQDYFIKDNQYHIVEPEKAIAFFRFNGEGNIYGLTNAVNAQKTVEGFFEVISNHHSFFDTTPINDSLLQTYGFTHKQNEWDLDIRDREGNRNQLRYIDGRGWYIDKVPLKNQPSNVRDLMTEYVKLTGTAMTKANRYFS